MTAYNVVRFKVKSGQEQKFIDMHKNLPDLDGMNDGALIKTGDRPTASSANGKILRALWRPGPA